MLSIPLPYIASLFFLLITGLVWVKRPVAVNRITAFLLLCSASTLVVGLRWTVDIQLVKFLQPVLASLLPVMAWYCFFMAERVTSFSVKHAVAPCIIFLCSLTYPWWTPPIDFMLVGLFIWYGVRLLLAAQSDPERVRFFDVQTITNLKYTAGIMLLFSAAIDATLSMDIAFFQGENVSNILTFSYLVLIPTLAIAVLVVGSLTCGHAPSPVPEQDASNIQLDFDTATDIVEKLSSHMEQEHTYLDPNLTLDRLARKLGLPSRQISLAVNLIYHRNVSRVINEYRIKRAQTLLKTTELSITEIYLDSGFNTKSNFNREFNRVTSTTPSAYRRAND
ncbi:helix-turn-helix domain-containing protein [Motilimonas cestriensis]|uniref:helix-turn-helix domain-containing protein n=1 Tax=Motilimonas cestriensis TaxID=2742685 RepID=UPI003DA58FC8